MPENTPTEEQPLARLTVPARLDYLPAVLDLVRDLASLHGLGPRTAERTAFIAEEACAHVMEHAYADGEPGTIELLLFLRRSQLVFAMDDHGLPFDFRDFPTEHTALTGLLGRTFQGTVRCFGRGKLGNRIELSVPLPARAPLAHEAEAEMARAAAAAPAAADAPLTLRLIQPADAEGVTRCLYRTYGYTYFDEHLYDPDEMRRRMASGTETACVAVDPAGEVVGYFELLLQPPGTTLGEAATAIVDPRYRGHHLFERMKAFIRDHGRSLGLRGIYSEAVTAHPYTQKGSLAVGAHEIGILLADLPAGISFTGIARARVERAATVMLYLPVNAAPPREAWLPARHAAMIGRILEHCGLARTARSVPDGGPPAEAPATSAIDIHVDADVNEAYLQVRTAGKNLDSLLRARLGELCRQRVDVIYLDVPLGTPAAAAYFGRLETLGFFFAGVVPEKPDGDFLRLQYLNDVATDEGNIQLASDFGRELLDYVLQARSLSAS